MSKETIKAETKIDKQPISRGEFKKVLNDVFENMNSLTQYLMSDMNTLFQKHVYPDILRLNAIVEILNEKGISITDEEITAKANQLMKNAIEKAKQVKETEEGKLEEVAEVAETVE